ncbi:MAG: hypothetical protein IKE36_08235 [Solobacterium sp.]|nr:hypothetical protein [Solobacterium sp.]
MMQWIKALITKLRRQDTSGDNDVRRKPDAEINEALRNARDQSWNNAGDARRNHPGSNAGRL